MFNEQWISQFSSIRIRLPISASLSVCFSVFLCLTFLHPSVHSSVSPSSPSSPEISPYILFLYPSKQSHSCLFKLILGSKGCSPVWGNDREGSNLLFLPPRHPNMSHYLSPLTSLTESLQLVKPSTATWRETVVVPFMSSGMKGMMGGSNLATDKR